MKRFSLCLLTISIFLHIICGDGRMVLRGPYLGQEPPGMTATLFAPGIVSTEENDYLYGIFNNGATIIFDRTPVEMEEWTPAVFLMEMAHGKWTPPNSSPILGNPWYECYTKAPVGELVYFAWQGTLEDRSVSTNVDIWTVRMIAEGWAKPTKLSSPVNTDHLDTHPSVTESGTLYFFSPREGGLGGHDIYRSPSADGKHTVVENLGSPINTEDDELDPFIAPDESYLIFCSKTLNGFGGYDLYISYQKGDGTWTEPKNMGEGINSSAYDWVPYVSPDGAYFFFNSLRHGSWDVFWVDAKIIEDLKPDVLK